MFLFFFFVGIARYVAFFLPFCFWLPLQDMLHLNFLAPLIFCNHCKICCILDFGRLLLHAASKLHYLIKLINWFSTPLHVFYGEISYSTPGILWREVSIEDHVDQSLVSYLLDLAIVWFTVPLAKDWSTVCSRHPAPLYEVFTSLQLTIRKETVYCWRLWLSLIGSVWPPLCHGWSGAWAHTELATPKLQ